MRVEDIRIERFGVWRELSLSLPEPNVNVLYGANEAGKSTLLRFLRGMLYGTGETPRGGREFLDGGLATVHDGRRCDLARRIDESGDRLSVTGGPHGVTPRAVLDDLLQGVDRNVFERVFAIGLDELQELGTLDDDAIAEQLYGATLGADGRRVADLRHAFASRRQCWTGDDGGRLASLLAEYDRLQSELQATSRSAERYEHAIEEIDRHQSQIASLRERRENVARELRGLRLVERAREPWREVDRLRGELAALPADELPPGAVARLNRLDDAFDERTRAREENRRQIRRLRERAGHLRDDAAFLRFEPLVRTLVDRKEWHERTSRAATELRESLTEDAARTEEALSALGQDWTRERLDAFDASRSARDRLNAAARDYERAIVRRRRLQRLRRRLSKRVQSLTERLRERSRALQGTPVREALDDARGRLVELRELGRLRTREAELEQRRLAIGERREWLDQRARLPEWVFGVLAFFGVAGMVFAVLGLATGLTSSLLAGTAYALLGVTCGSLAWNLGSHLSPRSESDLEELDDERTATEAELRETRERIARLTGRDLHDAPDSEAPDDAELTATLVREIADLEDLAAATERSIRLRKRQTELRARHQSVQSEFAAARGRWCEAVREAGLAETLRTGDAFEEWEAAAATVAALREQAGRRRELEGLERSHADFRDQVDAVAGAIGDPIGGPPERRLAEWELRVERASASAGERTEVAATLRRRRRDEQRLALRVAWVARLRRALLRRLGVASREELEDRVAARVQREELRELLALAEEDLAAVAEGETELAIVEEDFRDFDPAAHGEAVERADRERQELDERLQRAHEELGRLREEAAALERDRTASRLRFDRERTYERVREAIGELLAVEAGEQALQHAVEQLERDWQPPALEEASRFLARLTQGRHQRVWTPLGRHELRIDGEVGKGLDVSQLSRGTREQLFLALRLAMVSRLASEGVELPLVLDDVFVNFDQERTEAAVRTLLDFAGESRQVLFFTCHLHVAELFQQAGVEPVWLPSHDRREERLAG